MRFLPSEFLSREGCGHPHVAGCSRRSIRAVNGKPRFTLTQHFSFSFFCCVLVYVRRKMDRSSSIGKEAKFHINSEEGRFLGTLCCRAEDVLRAGAVLSGELHIKVGVCTAGTTRACRAGFFVWIRISSWCCQRGCLPVSPPCAISPFFIVLVTFSCPSPCHRIFCASRGYSVSTPAALRKGTGSFGCFCSARIRSFPRKAGKASSR